MKFKPSSTLVLLFSFLISCTTESIDTVDDFDGRDYAQLIESDAIFPDRVVVQFKQLDEEIKPNISSRGFVVTGVEELDRIAESIGVTEIRRFFNDGGRFEQRHRKYGLHLWYEIIFDESTTVTRAISDIGRLDMINHIEPALKIHRLDNPVTARDIVDSFSPAMNEGDDLPFNDPYLPGQWHYHNDGTVTNSLPGADINLFNAWQVTTGNPEVIVCVVDSGVDFEHEDLMANMWINPGEISGNGRDDDNNGYVDDIHGYNFYRNRGVIEPGNHGTHVAGTISAVNNNGIGMAGIAGGSGNNDGVKIMTCQVFAPSDRSSADYRATCNAITYGADNGAVISQNSWSYNNGLVPNETFARAYQTAIDYFINTAGWNEDETVQTGPMAGGVVFFAAGNTHTTSKAYPSAYDGVVAVSAIGPDYLKASYSAFGDWVAIAAPGGTGKIFGKYGEDTYVFSTTVGNEYDGYEGTSMATPHISGVAALIISHFAGPGFTNEMLLERMMSAALDIDDYNRDVYPAFLGTPLVDAAKALADDNGIAPASVSGMELERDEENKTVQFNFIMPSDQNGMSMAAFSVISSHLPFTAGDVQGDNIIVKARGMVGKPYTLTVEDIEPGANYYFGIASVDMFGNRSDYVFAESIVGSVLQPGEFIQINPFENHYFDGLGDDFSYSYYLPDYFALDPSAEFEAVSSSNVVKVDITNKILTITATDYGNAKVTVAATNYHGDVAVGTILTMARNSVNELDLYPLPVVDNLNILMGKNASGPATLRIYNSAGQKVVDRNITIDPFIPSVVDMSKTSGGTYNLSLIYGGKEIKRTFTKK